MEGEARAGARALGPAQFRVGAGSVGPATSGHLQGLMRGRAPSGLPECLGWVPQRVRDEDGWVSGMGGGTWRTFVSS